MRVTRPILYAGAAHLALSDERINEFISPYTARGLPLGVASTPIVTPVGVILTPMGVIIGGAVPV